MKELFQVAEVQLTYRTNVKPADRPQVTCSADAFRVFRQYWSDNIEMIEECYLILLNRSNRVLGIMPISSGGLSSTIIDTRLVYAAAIKALASSIIIAHNHPSGHLRPSQADIDLTRSLKAAGEALDIALQDHLIVAPGSGFYSFADDGLI